MVCNKFKVLNGYQIENFVPEVIEMKKPAYVYQFEHELCQMNLCFMKKQIQGDHLQDLIERGITLDVAEKEEKYYRETCNEWNEKYESNEFLKKFLFETSVNSKCEFNQIARYYDIKPFSPSVMLNISPDWNGVKRKFGTDLKISILKEIFENYMKENWYDEWEYVIENGESGKNIHLHAVCHFNTQRLKSVETHIKKGNHTQRIKKYGLVASKGIEGLIKGNSVQSCLLRTEAIVSDKKDYLIEERKPFGHKNKSVITEVIRGTLTTVK